MTEYTLFLDESYDDNTDLFCIAGCIIKNSDLNIVSNKIESIKQAPHRLRRHAAATISLRLKQRIHF